MHSNKLYLKVAVFCATLLLFAYVRPAVAFQNNLSVLPSADAAQEQDVPDVTARVARISFVSGSVQIKRADTDEWERAVLNLPVVEGDEINTDKGSRLEIQFDSDSYARLGEDTSLKIMTLRDEGVAVSMTRGRGAFRLFQFDLTRAFFEIDAPGTTVATQKAGMYDISAAGGGDANDVRVTVTESGEARVYTESSGFLLKDGRTALLQVGGADAGEFETGRADTYADEFDDWSLRRDSAIVKSMQSAAYGKYYDNDLYGAEDLDGYGEWIYTKRYGYVWRPFATATSSYASWSPYRYGQWRWVPPYGWTWVNDEPWGWATYHHGRWFFDDGYWYWSPYGAYRNTRSWWSPALVYVTIYAGNVCWYPLPYSYAYYNYNHYYNHRGGWPQGGPPQNGGGRGPRPTPTPSPGPVTGTGTLVTSRIPHPPLGTVPPGGVVSVPANEFGRMTKGNLTPPLSVANSVLSRVPTVSQTDPVLPPVSDVRQRGAREIIVERPPTAALQTSRTGAATRRPGAPLDQDLRTTRIFGDRKPVTAVPTPSDTARPDMSSRPTGAVERQRPVAPRPVVRPPVVSTPPEDNSPRIVTPTRREPLQTSRPPAPRYEPPVRQEPPISRPPRQEPPVTRQPQPRDQPPAVKPQPRDQPPAVKPQPKPEVKPPLQTDRKKDGVD